MSPTINLNSIYMGLGWLSHLDPGVLTSFIILPWLNLLHLSKQHGHMQLLHQETRTHCLLLKNCLVFTWLGCSQVNGGNGTNLPIEGWTSSMRSQINQVQGRDWKPKPCTQQSFSHFSTKANTEGSTLAAASILPHCTDRRCQSPVRTAVSHCMAVLPTSRNTHLQHDHGAQAAMQRCYVLLYFVA